MSDEELNDESSLRSTLDSLSESGGILPLDSLYDIPVKVTVILGKREISISDLLNLDTSSVLELDAKVGDPVDVHVNKRLVARGEVVIVEDQVGITMTEIIKNNIYLME